MRLAIVVEPIVYLWKDCDLIRDQDQSHIGRYSSTMNIPWIFNYSILAASQVFAIVVFGSPNLGGQDCTCDRLHLPRFPRDVLILRYHRKRSWMWDDGPVGSLSLSLSPTRVQYGKSISRLRNEHPKAVYRLKSRENRSHPLLYNITGLSEI